MLNAELFKEVSPLSSKDCFIIMERLKSTFNFPIHIHPEYELNYIENAQGAQRFVGDSVEEIDEQELVLIANSRLEHAWMNHQCRSQNIHEVTIQFHPDLLSESFLNKNQLISIQEFFKSARKGLAFSRQAIDKVRPILKTITCETDSFYSVIKLFIILHELSVDSEARELSSHSFTGSGDEKYSNHPRINKVVDYLNAHYAESVHLSDVASLVNMSDASFCRFIKQHTSKSFVDFLTDIRIGKAIRALVDSPETIAEIGYSCGFNNLSNFNRIFKKRKGVTPTEFRENYRKKRTII
ncbi:MAG: AraC family transcriptional regulator [Parabacteroides sp.]|nr:AraC family transcriptional regulator [Parabacteroides sp.]